MRQGIIVELAERMRRLAAPGLGELAPAAIRSERARREVLRLDAADLGWAPPPLASLGSGGEPEVARWLAARLGRAPDGAGEILVLRGPIAPHHLVALAFVNAGDAVLAPDPAPPVLRAAALLVGGVPMKEAAGPLRLQFLAPCGAPAGLPDSAADVDAAVRAALRDSRIVAVDVSGLLLDHGSLRAVTRFPSLLAHPRGADVGVEIVTFDALFGAGRAPLSIVAGHRDLITGVRRIAAALGVPAGAPAAPAVAAFLDAVGRTLDAVRPELAARRDALVEGLGRLGFRVVAPAAGLSLWVAVPRGFRAVSFARMLVRRAGIVVRPGVEFGESGEGFVAISLAPPAAVLHRALGRIEEMAPRTLRLRRQLVRSRRWPPAG
jgi:LL-diaminopimelate aminotransferase